MRMMLDGIRRHIDSPEVSHLRPLVTDIVSTIQDLQNDFERRVSEIVPALAAAGVSIMLPDILDGFLKDKLPALVAKLVAEGMQDMSDIVDKLTGAVADLTAKVAAHDSAVQAGVAEIKTLMASSVAAGTMSADDQAKISAAIDAVGAASAVIAGESSALSASLPPTVPAAAPADPAAPTA